MTESYEHIRNKHCHEVLTALYQHSSGVARESTLGDMMEGKPGRLFSNRFFFNLDLAGLADKLNVSDVLLQEVCEYLELNNHIEAATKTDKGIFEKIRFTPSGLTAYKTNYYLKENKKLTDDKWIRRSTLFNNWTTPFIALAALIIAINECNGKDNDKPSDKVQTDQETIKSPKSETRHEVPVQYHPTNNTDTLPKLIKRDSLTKPRPK